MQLADLKKANLPDSPGVYFFRRGDEILYIGKATSLKDRVKSYFSNDLMKTRGRLLVDMVAMAETVTYEKTDSVLEAFLLESELIRKHQPKSNTDAKDDKSFNYVVITKEDFPRILVIRGRELENAANHGTHDSLGFEYTDKFGPYPHGLELREAMKLIRRIFPYRDEKCIPYDDQVRMGKIQPGQPARPCFNRTIGLCPGVCTGEISKRDYKWQVNNIRLFFKGKKGTINTELKRQMKICAKKMEFENAHQIKKTLIALNHIQDISMIKKDPSGDPVVYANPELARLEKERDFSRVEAYDIAHLSGKDMVGVMTVLLNGEFAKHEYKKFNIKTLTGSNDTAAMQEMLRRRLAHLEWAYPDIMVIDGGQAQLNAAEIVLREVEESSGKDLKGLLGLVSVVKDERHKAREILFSHSFPISAIENDAAEAERCRNIFIRINAEAHRFAVTAHTKRRAISRGLNFKRKRT